VPQQRAEEREGLHRRGPFQEGAPRQPFLLDERVRPARVTVSLGVSEYKGDRKRFFRSADRALYQAKAAGKDCVRTGD